MEFLKADLDKLLLEDLIVHRKLIYQKLTIEKDLIKKKETYKYLNELDEKIAENNPNKIFLYDEI